MSDALLQLDNQLCHRFYMVSNAFSRVYRPLLKELDITYPQYVVMMALWEQDHITIKQLLERTRIDGGAMSLMLKKLVQKGFVHIDAHQSDKRARIVVLTEFGQNAKRAAKHIPEQMLCHNQSLSEAELKTLMGLIDKLHGDLNHALCQLEEPQ